MNNSLLRLSPWETQWKSLRGAFSAPVAIDPALSTKFIVRGPGSLAWAQNCLLAPSCTRVLDVFHLLLQTTLHFSTLLCALRGWIPWMATTGALDLQLPLEFSPWGAPVENAGIMKIPLHNSSGKELKKFIPSAPSLRDHYWLAGSHIFSWVTSLHNSLEVLGNIPSSCSFRWWSQQLEVLATSTTPSFTDCLELYP